MHPYVEIFWLCYLSIKSPSFAHICFSFVKLPLILAKCLIHLKTLQGNFGNLIAVNIKSMFSVTRGCRKMKYLVGHVKVNWKPPHHRWRSVKPQIDPHIICQFIICPEKES